MRFNFDMLAWVFVLTFCVAIGLTVYYIKAQMRPNPAVQVCTKAPVVSAPRTVNAP